MQSLAFLSSTASAETFRTVGRTAHVPLQPEVDPDPPPLPDSDPDPGPPPDRAPLPKGDPPNVNPPEHAGPTQA
jgi:hypothetical protein